MFVLYYLILALVGVVFSKWFKNHAKVYLAILLLPIIVVVFFILLKKFNENLYFGSFIPLFSKILQFPIFQFFSFTRGTISSHINEIFFLLYFAVSLLNFFDINRYRKEFYLYLQHSESQEVRDVPVRKKIFTAFMYLQPLQILVFITSALFLGISTTMKEMVLSNYQVIDDLAVGYFPSMIKTRVFYFHFVLLIAFGIYIWKYYYKNIGFNKTAKITVKRSVIALSVYVVFCVITFYMVALDLYKPIIKAQSYFFLNSINDLPAASFFLFIFIIPASYLEELFYRYYLNTNIFYNYQGNVVCHSVICSIIFTVFHVFVSINILYLVIIFIISNILILFKRVYSNIGVNTLIHGLFNASVIIFALVLRAKAVL